MKNKNLPGKNFPLTGDEAYFNKLEEDILAKISGNRYHLPIGIKAPFVAPDGYFEQLEIGVLSQIRVSETSSPFKTIWRNYSQTIRVAAIFIVISLAGLLVYQQQKQPAVQAEGMELSELETEAIMNYLESESLSINDLALAVENTDILSGSGFLPETKLRHIQEDELLELIDFQYSNDI